MKRATPEKASGFPQKLLLGLLRVLASAFRLPGFKGLSLLGRFGAFCFWHLSASRRNLAIDAIMKHLGKNQEEAARIARQSFSHNFQSFLEILLAKSFKIDNNPRLEPLPELFRQMEREEGPVVATLGHIGSWELLAGLFSEYRPGRSGLIVVRNYGLSAMNELMQDLRSQGSIRSIGHRNAAAEVAACLRSGGTAGFLVDHNTLRADAIFLPFLGETAAVNLGPALLALRSKAVIYPAALFRKEGGKYELVVLNPLRSGELSGSISERAAQIAAFYTKAMEELVRAHPEQWFWMHKRWKTKPE